MALPYGQVLTALSTNLVDGAENNWPSFVATGHYKVARYYTVTEHTMGPEVLVMSQRAWQELSPEDRTIFRDGRARIRANTCATNGKNGRSDSRRQAEEAGVTIISTIDRKPFEDATKPLRDATARRSASFDP